MFDKVGMPHVMWSLQGEMVPVMKKHGEHEVVERLVLAKPGSVTLAEYDSMVGDLVNYLVWMGEPAQVQRKQLGVIVPIFLGIFFVVACYLKKEFRKDIPERCHALWPIAGQWSGCWCFESLMHATR